MEPLINFIPAIERLLMTKFANFVSSSLGNDIYYACEFVTIASVSIGENKLKNMLINDTGNNKERNKIIGQNWDAVNGFAKSLQKLTKLDVQTKDAYDQLKDPTYKLTKDIKNDKTFLNFVKRASLIPAINTDLISVMVFIFDNSNLKNKPIPSELIRNLEMKGSKLTALNRYSSLNERQTY